MNFAEVTRFLNAALAVWCCGLTVGRLTWYVRDYRYNRDHLRFWLTTRTAGEAIIYASVFYGNTVGILRQIPVTMATYSIFFGMFLVSLSLPGIVKYERQVLRNWDQRKKGVQ